MRAIALLRRLGIEPGETRVFAWGAAALFLVGWVDVSVKNVAEVFFLKRVGVELMPLAFLVSSLLLVLTTWAFGRFAARRDRVRMLPRVFLALGLVLVPLWLLVGIGFESAFGLLLIASKQITSIALLVFWIAMGDLLHSRQTKRLFAPMMAGVTLGTILGSFASKPLGEWLGIAGLLPLSAVAMVLGGAAASRLCDPRPRLEGVRSGVASPVEDSGTDAAESTAGSLWREHALFRLLVITTLCSGVLGPMLYFQFQYVADLATTGQGGEEKLLAFYAQFRGWIYGAVLVIQLVGSGGLYRRLGLPLAVAISPLTYLAGFLGLSVRLSLPAGVAAMAGTKVQDEAVYDPALRVLYSLFPESNRARATALIEGPMKRGGGAVGNAAIVVALALGSAAWVGYLALPITLVWLLASLVLWRRYPQLLLEAAAARRGRHESLENELLDPATVRALAREMSGEDSGRARLAVELVRDADAELAIAILADTVARAPDATRPSIVAALERRLADSTTDPSVPRPEAARQILSVLMQDAVLGEGEHADLVQIYARLEPGDAAVPLLERELREASPAVRLAALAALARRAKVGAEPRDLTPALNAALRGVDPDACHTARKALRSLLLDKSGGEQWHARLELLADAFADGFDRAETADTLAEIAKRHGARVAECSRRVLDAREDPDPRVRSALLRWAGYAGQHDQLAWLIDHLAFDEHEASAREGVRALGTSTSNTLLRELFYGKRSKREAIVEVMRELDLRPGELRELYEIEIETVRADLTCLLALRNRPPLALLRQRLAERVRETLHTALLFLAAICDEEQIAQLGERLRETPSRPRERAIVVEALDSLLPAEHRQRVIPL